MADHDLKDIEADTFMGRRAHCACGWVSVWEEEVGDAIAEHDAHQLDQCPPDPGGELYDEAGLVPRVFPPNAIADVGRQRRFVGLRRRWRRLCSRLPGRRPSVPSDKVSGPSAD